MPNSDDGTCALVIRRSTDETIDLFLDGAFVTGIDIGEAGLSGAAVAYATAKLLGKAFGADVVEEDIR
ncbi:MAG: hypothetical protein ABW022_14765 [Actinoplanes sp.]